MKTQKQIKKERSKREDMKAAVAFAYFFARIFASAGIWKLHSGNTTKGLVGIVVASLTIILAEKIRRRIKLTLTEMKH